MQKKILLGILILVALFTITGCGKGTKTEDGKTQFTCIKKDEELKTLTGEKYKNDSKYTAKVDDDRKLIYYEEEIVHKYNSKDVCEEEYDYFKDRNDDLNEAGYPGAHKETTNNCSNNEVKEQKIYDDIKNLHSIHRSDIKQLKEDNSFDVDTWISKKEANGYSCN